MPGSPGFLQLVGQEGPIFRQLLRGSALTWDGFYNKLHANPLGPPPSPVRIEPVDVSLSSALHCQAPSGLNAVWIL